MQQDKIAGAEIQFNLYNCGLSEQTTLSDDNFLQTLEKDICYCLEKYLPIIHKSLLQHKRVCFGYRQSDTLDTSWCMFF